MMKLPLVYLTMFFTLTALVQIACGLGTPAAPAAVSTAPAVHLAAPTQKLTTPTGSATPAPGLQAVPTTTSTAVHLNGPLYAVINPAGGAEADLQNSFILTANNLGSNASKYETVITDTNLEISQVNAVIKDGAKGIAMDVFAPVTALGPNISKAARSAGVVFITLMTPIKDDKGHPVPIVRFDQTEMGKKVGETAGKLLTESGWLKDPKRKVGVLLLVVRNQLGCSQRTNAEQQTIKSAGVTDRQIFTLQYDNIMIDSKTTTPGLLKSHPNITNWVVMGCDDYGVAGSLQALDASGVKAEDIIAVGAGAGSACADWSRGKPSGFKAAVIFSNTELGKTAAEVLNDAVVNGKAPPAVTIVPSVVVDPTNFKILMDPSTVNCLK
jgi:L-arabinose transport system substrate-binding protein